MTKFGQAALLAFLALILTTIGCGGEKRPDGMPPLNPCKLTFKAGGQGLENATVSLFPTDPKVKWVAAGTTDAKGIAVMKTGGKFNGAPAGSYKVVVSKTERDYGEYGPPPTDPVELDAWNRKIDVNEIKTISLIDPSYSDISTTELTIDIAEGKNEQEFDLGDLVQEELRNVEK